MKIVFNIFVFLCLFCAVSAGTLPGDVAQKCAYFNAADSTVSFVFDTAQWHLSPKQVYVAGTFNEWHADAPAYALAENGGAFTLTVPYKSVAIPGNCGRPEYKFVADGKYLDVPDFVPEGWRFDNRQACLVIPSGDSDAKAVKSANAVAKKVKKLVDFKLPAKKAQMEISNYRLVPGTEYLYRTYHPFKASSPDNSTELFRLKYAVSQAEASGIASDICLSGNETDSLKSYVINHYQMVETIPQYYRQIIDGGNVIYVGEGYEIPSYEKVYYQSDSELFALWVKDIVKFIIDDKHPVPMTIHCRLGTDRTGVFCAVLAGLCGASWSDIAKDYSQSAKMGIGEYRDPLLLKYSLDKLLSQDVSQTKDLKAALSAYFISGKYLTQDDIDRLNDRLK